jgi:hypothetical protein
MEAVAEAVEPRSAGVLDISGKRAQRGMGIVGRKELAQPGKPACFFKVQVGDQQRLSARPLKRAGRGR